MTDIKYKAIIEVTGNIGKEVKKHKKLNKELESEKNYLNGRTSNIN